MGALCDVLVGLSIDETNRAANKIIASEIEQIWLYLNNLKERVEELEEEVSKLKGHHATYGGAKLRR